MNISRFSVNRPVFTTMVTLIIMILGGVALNRLPVDLMPEITYPSLSVSTEYDNAGPEQIEDLITRPIEQAVSAVPGVQEVESTSSDRSSNVRVSFIWGTNLDEAANDIRDRLDRIANRLPTDAGKPTLRKFDLSQFPILILGVTSNLDPIEVRKIVEEQISYRIERVPGVAAVDVWGGQEQEIQVLVFAEKLKALGLPISQIISSIKSQNVSVPTGVLRKGNYELMVSTSGEYRNLNELNDTVVAVRDGVSIQLKEIADIVSTHKKSYQVIKINGKPGIQISVQKQSLANTVDVAKETLKELERINADIPQLDLIPLVNTAKYIETSIGNVESMAGIGGLLAVLVFIVFLRSFRSTAIISTAIPISIIGTFVFMYFSGFTLNLMTLGGLAIGVGMIVDNSIVVLENIFRLQKTGQPMKVAAINGSGEGTSAIIASTLTTLVIFLPLIFIRGMTGIMFKQLAYVISFALLCSLGAALTVIPMLISKMPKLKVKKRIVSANQENGNGQKTIGESIILGYQQLLIFVLKHKIMTVLFTVALLILSMALIPFIGVEYMPSADEGQVRVNIEMEVGTRLEVLEEKYQTVEKIINESVPELENVVVRLGSSSWHGGSHSGRIQITLKPLIERSRSSDQIANDLRRKLMGIPGLQVRTRAGQGLFIFRLISGGNTERIQIDIKGFDLERARLLAGTIKEKINDIPGVTDVRLSLEAGRTEQRIMVDRARAAQLHLNVSDIADNLQTIISGTNSGTFRNAGREFDILVKIKDTDQMNLEDVLDLTVVNKNNEPITMKNVVFITSKTTPLEIRRKDQERTVTVSVNISDRDMNTVLADIRESLKEVVIPKDFSIVYAGDYEAQQEAFRELMVGILLAIILVYMVLACLYESLRDPLLVLFSVPLASVGVVLMLFLTGTTFNVQSFIGCIMLAGIVVNNAILLVDHINLLRDRDGMPVEQAIIEAGTRRLRPIVMTALTTSLGMLPLSLGIMEGSETQASLARAVIGGLTSSTLITLIFIPVLYMVFERLFPKKKPEFVEA